MKEYMKKFWKWVENEPPMAVATLFSSGLLCGVLIGLVL